jgi:hypothetical protein
MPMLGRRRITVVGSLVAIAVGACAYSPSAGAATVTVGAPGGGGPGGGSLTNFGAEPITVVNSALGEAGAHVSSPVNGTIVSWHVKTLGTGNYALHVIRPAAGGQFTGVSTTPGNVTAAGDHTFTASVPIQTGDLIAVDVPGGQGVDGHFLATGSAYELFSPAITDGSTVSPSGTPFTDVEALFSAVVQYSDTTTPPPATPGSSAKKCKKKKKHKSAAQSAKKSCKKKKKH